MAVASASGGVVGGSRSPNPDAATGGSSGGPSILAAASSPQDNERCSKRPRLSLSGSTEHASSSSQSVFGSETHGGRLYLGAQTATVEWRVERFQQQRSRADGHCLDGPKFGPRELWQIFCHPDGRCFNQPQGGPPGVFLRYLGSHERVPAYATIEKLVDGEFRVPENNARDAPFVVLFGRNEIEEWGVCKDFGLFDDAFSRGLVNESLVLRARVAWIEPRADSLLPHEVVVVRRNSALGFVGAEGSLQVDFASLWNARRPLGAGPSGGPALSDSAGGGPGVPADLVLLCEQQRFEADRVVLAARSAFFGAMFANRQFRESEQQEVELKGFSARSLSSSLRFIYTDEPPDLRSREEAEEMLATACKLGINGLLRGCSDYLRDTWLTTASAVGLVRLADAHGATSLRADALAVLASNFDEVKTSPEWEDLLQTGMNPTLIQDTLQAVQDASIFAGRASIKT
mmetsp:Transcript_18305/g.42747  ORF Transcript_18305/g.42747 Transcript_18305/m.42747 type:complete len:460 (+) Transcript_18305:82-1461(+)